MSFRITTNGMFRNYRSNLYKNNKMLNDSITRVQTQRKFSSYAEDPAAASRAFQLRRSYWRMGDQIDNSEYLVSKFSSAYTAIAAIVDGDQNNQSLASLESALRGLNDPTGNGRSALGQQLQTAAESVVRMMNTQYGDDFVFAGADGANVPFEWGTNANGEKALLYRGVDVNTEEPIPLEELGLTDRVLADFNLTSKALDSYDPSKTDIGSLRLEKPLTKEEFQEDGYDANNLTDSLDVQYANYQEDYVRRNEALLNSLNISADLNDSASVAKAFSDAQSLETKLKAYQDYAGGYLTRNGMTYEQGAESYEKLKEMANEPLFVDIGLGMRENNGQLVESSAFDGSLSGVAILGYGRDQNLAVVMHELGEIFSRTNDNGYYTQPGDEKRANELLDRFHDALSRMTQQHVKITTDTQFLKSNINQLDSTQLDMKIQIEETERVDEAAAISEMSWAQYCYNAALRVGNSILSQSLLDYMS